MASALGGAAAGGSALAARLPLAAAAFFERRGKDAALRGLEGPVLLGLARALAAGADAARYLSHRPALLERIAAAGPRALRTRAAELARDAPSGAGDASSLEDFLDGLRLWRRDETLFAACVELGGLATFEEVSEFLSLLAERITATALARARGGPDGASLAIVGMGKIAGRELTHHSDLDLIFLYDGPPEAIDEPSRVAQRLIAYLGTQTGAGVAYSVDSRLRPSGRQGMLVTTLPGFEHYQREQAALWEHLALMRARVIAPAGSAAMQRLARVRAAVSGARRPWSEVAEMRARVVRERGTERPSELRFKAGAGGIMDVEFLATGALLEIGAQRLEPALPAIPSMLRASARGARVERLLADYAFLRRLEARARFSAGRAVELVRTDAESLAPIAELLEPGGTRESLLAQVSAVRTKVAGDFERVVAAGTIGALADAA